MSEPQRPILDFTNTFKAEIPVGDHVLPIKVKRYGLTAWREFEKGWALYVQPRRGTTEGSSEAPPLPADFEQRQLAFYEGVVVDAVSLEPGLVRLEGRDVTTGADLLDLFCSRADVIGSLVVQVYLKNRLTDVMRKNSSSPHGSDPGSTLGTQEGGGGKPEPTAGNAGRSTTAASGPVLVEHPSKADASGSSGATRDDEGPIVH